ncbi:MAG: hypothetical protein Q8O62_07340 [Aequorivita sp.]|nr:hypothetical protein [Aequorivita sp.]
MKTAINEFWTTFSLIQKNLIFANSTGNQHHQTDLCSRLDSPISAVHPKLNFLIIFQYNNTDTAKLIFLTLGKPTLKLIAGLILAEAPSFPLWQFQAGIKPYKHSIISLCANYRFLGPETNIYQIYFAVQKIYKTTNKLHLILYLEMDKQRSKSELNDVMHPILLCFLGDAYYHQHISRYRIVRRKYSRIKLIPLDELKHLIQYKTFN